MKALVVLELSKTQVEVAKKLHDSQVEAITKLHEFQIKLACIPNKKTMNKLVNRYIENDGLLVKELEIMKNKSNILIFISLNKVPIIQKHWLITEYNK